MPGVSQQVIDELLDNWERVGRRKPLRYIDPLE